MQKIANFFFLSTSHIWIATRRKAGDHQDRQNAIKKTREKGKSVNGSGGNSTISEPKMTGSVGFPVMEIRPSSLQRGGSAYKFQTIFIYNTPWDSLSDEAQRHSQHNSFVIFLWYIYYVFFYLALFPLHLDSFPLFGNIARTIFSHLFSVGLRYRSATDSEGVK